MVALTHQIFVVFIDRGSTVIDSVGLGCLMHLFISAC